MRIAIIVALTVMLAAPAFALDITAQLEQAERERDAIMNAVDDAILAGDWDTACTKAKQATATQREIANTASDWFDNQEYARTLDEKDYRSFGVRVTRLYQAHADLAQADAGICAKAAE